MGHDALPLNEKTACRGEATGGLREKRQRIT